LTALEKIQTERKRIWQRYWDNFSNAKLPLDVQLPVIPSYATNNAHMFYLVCPSLERRTAIINALKSNNVLAVFHYQSLHSSSYFADKHDGRVLANCDRYTDCLVRLPLFPELSNDDVDMISEMVIQSASAGRVSVVIN
jgi:dTDP-4-amino-4,6-dideoxygalactose transaminase